MNIAQLNLVAVVGRQGFIGNAGERPCFPDEESAMSFRARFVHLCTGGSVIVGGRTYRQLVKHGFDHKTAPFRVFVWDRVAQDVMQPEDAVSALSEEGDPVFIVGGRYTYECFMPWVEQMFITRAALTVGAEPLYLPELFGRSQ